MNTDTLSIVVKTITDKMTNGIKGAINVYKQLNNTINETTNNINKMPNSMSNANNGFSKSKQQIADLEKELKSLSETYRLHNKAFSERPKGMSFAKPYFEGSDWITNPTAKEDITQGSLDKEKEKINELKSTINELKNSISDVSKKPINIVSPKANETAKKFSDIGKKSDETKNKVNRLNSSMRSLGTTSSMIGTKGFDVLKNKFSNFSKDFGKNINNNVKQIKKFALGLIGVRTAMSVLTKSVNAYLSFDSELQDSLTNSWNMLGSLLAPAIEFVARMFSIATNYIAQFVNALTGINLVARANAKALQTQAKANAQANKEMQRGLLGMDEITNLPTEPSTGGGGSAPQIQIDDTVKSFKALDNILNHLKNGEWHLLGEDIARGINKILYSIDWAKVKQNAYKFGWNFADFLNGLFEVDWSQLGRTIAETMNTFVLTVKGFLDRFSFIQLGSGMARMLNHAFLDFDWDTAAETINTGIQKIGDGLSVFLTTFKWGDIGQKFGDFVASIDWGSLLFEAIKNSLLLAKGIEEFITNFFEGIFSRIADKITNKVNQIFTDLKNGNINFMDWLKNAVSGAFKGIVNVVIGTLNRVIKTFNTFLLPLRSLIVALGNVAGKKWTMNNISLPTIPTLAVGTPEIETEGLYHLHEGEMVVPKRYNPNTDGYDNGKDNKQIIDLLISLNSSMIEYANRPININMNSRKVAEGIYDDTQFLDSTKNKSTAIVRS